MVKDRLKKTCVKIDPIKIKNRARKHLREIANKSNYDRKKYSFKEYLNSKRKNDIILNQLISDAQLDSESANSLNLFLEYKEPGTEAETEDFKNMDIIEEEKMDEPKNDNDNKDGNINENNLEYENVNMNDNNINMKINMNNLLGINRNRRRSVLNSDVEDSDEEIDNNQKNEENDDIKTNINDNELNMNNPNQENILNNNDNIISTNTDLLKENENICKEEGINYNENESIIDYNEINNMNNFENRENLMNKNNDIKEDSFSQSGKDLSIIGEENEELNEPPGPLDGKVIVITGETKVPKEYFRVLLARLGARVTFSVSSRTTLLIHGDRLEDGRKFFEGIKYKAALEKDIPTYSDTEFEEYMQELVKDRNWNLKEQIENLEGRDKIVVKKIKKTLMVTCPYSSAKGKKHRENRQRKRGNKKMEKKKKLLEKERDKKKKIRDKERKRKEIEKEIKEKIKLNQKKGKKKKHKQKKYSVSSSSESSDSESSYSSSSDSSSSDSRESHSTN